MSTFLVLGHKVRAEAREGSTPHGRIRIQTTALDTAASNESAGILFDLWRTSGAEVEANELVASLGIPHNSVHLEANEPMPFVVDDILIKFDNDRAAAALQALAELSKKTQVIFFTHHRHLVKLAAKNLSGSRLD